MLDRSWRRFEPVALSVLSGLLLTCAFPRTAASRCCLGCFGTFARGGPREILG